MGEAAKIEVHDDGSATIYTGTSPHGQGHDTAWSMIASEQTGIPMADRVVWGDTDLVPVGGGTMGSRSLQQGGAAVTRHRRARRQAKKLAAACSRPTRPTWCSTRTRRVPRGRHPAVAKTWAELAAASAPASPTSPTRPDFEAASATFPFGATSPWSRSTPRPARSPLRHVACDDAGRVLNPMLLEGQIHGGIAQGTAQALLEEVRYDADGNPITSNLADYAMISAAELPSVEVVHMETPTFVNPLGAKGIGESGTIGSTPAVQSAVVDALAHLGVRHIDMPTTPERVWQAASSTR
jgi:aerobic carbon-monoxide dehydrogenase large subunit